METLEPLIPRAASEKSDATVQQGGNAPAADSNHRRLHLLAELTRLIHNSCILVYDEGISNSLQLSWYIRSELHALRKMVLHPVEQSDCYQSELQNVNAGGFLITGLISDCGSHGYVVSCTDETKRLYAMKIARDYNEISIDVAAFSEIATHCSIKSLSCVDLRIPRLRSTFAQYGREALVMESLGPDLAVLREAQKNRRFSLKTVLQIAVSLLTAYEQLHNTGWLHLTAKPRNFCIGGTAATKHKIYAVDFGRAQRYMEMDLQWGLNHRPFLTGVCESPQAEPFQSVWGEKENTNTSRRDDMMSLSLALIYMGGYLMPWERARLNREQWIQSLQWGFERSMVGVFDEMLVYSYRMKYEEMPDYEKWRRKIREFAKSFGIELDGKFDWDEMICEDDCGRIVLKPGVNTQVLGKPNKVKSKLSSEQLRARRKRQLKKAAKRAADSC